MLAVALHCDPEMIAQGGLEVRNIFRISTRPKSLKEIRGIAAAGAAWLCTGYRGIGRLLGNGICPVIGGSSDARVFGAFLRIASAACWKAAAAFSSSLVR